MGEKQEKWSLVCEPIDYLDGIQSGLTVKRENGAPVAYMFNHKEAVMASCAPELFEALSVLYHKTIVGTEAERHAALDSAWSVLVKAKEAPDAQ